MTMATFGRGVTRRQAVAGGAALALSGAFGLGCGVSLAKGGSGAVLKHGEFEVLVVSDGNLTLPARLLAPEADPAARAAAIGSAVETVEPPCNITLLRKGEELILVDVGAGPNFMSGAGKLADNLAAAGIDAAKVTTVVLTHGHPDHLWGLIDEFEDTVRFSKAAYVMAGAELDMWLSPDATSKLPADRANFVPAAQRNIARIKDRLRTVKGGDDIVPGVRVVDTAGHSQGHISLEVAGPEPLVVLADALTHPVISFAHPDWRPAADHEPDRAVATRRRLLDRLAADKARVIGYHLPFPGLGRVERKDGAYRFVSGA